MTKTLLSVAALAAALGGVPAYAQHYVTVAPPPPRHEAMPAPRHGYHWVPGYWQWTGHRYTWVNGAWVRDRPGHYYAEPRWEQRDGRWVFHRGEWARGDRDHDGVPNAVDRHPNNPYRP